MPIVSHGSTPWRTVIWRPAGGRMLRAVMNRLRVGAGRREDHAERDGPNKIDRMCHVRSPFTRALLYTESGLTHAPKCERK